MAKAKRYYSEQEESEFQRVINTEECSFGNAPAITKEQADSLVAKGVDNMTNDEVVDLDRYYGIVTIPVPYKISQQLRQRIAKHGLDTCKNI